MRGAEGEELEEKTQRLHNNRSCRLLNRIRYACSRSPTHLSIAPRSF